MKVYDVAIVGGGIIGGIIAYELSKYKLKNIVFEKNPILADETTRGNSGVIHGGFDPEPHKIEARLNVLGNQMWREELFKHLDFPRAQLDSLIVAFNEEEEKHLQMLYDRGLENKVPKEFLKIISQSEIRKREPNISDKVTKALLCTSSWGIDAVAATRALFGASENNGLKIQRNSEVTAIKWLDDHFEITINGVDKFYAKNIINAAGHYADDVAALAGYPDFQQKTRRGEYRILARSERKVVNSIIFMVPTIHGKGVVVSPMVDGDILVGPTAEENVPKNETRLITKAKFDEIGKIGNKIIPSLKLDKTIKQISGSRPIDVETNDFVIRPAKGNKFFINAAGMQSPAIAAAPAIALEIVELIKVNGTKLEKNNNFDPNFKVMY